MPTDVDRAWAFMRRGESRGTVEVPWEFGTAAQSPEVPLRHDSNYLLVERGGEAGAIARAALATPMPGLHRKLTVTDASLGERLASGLAALGWDVHRGVVMVHRRPSDRERDLSGVREIGWETLRPARERFTRTYPWGTAEVAAQLLEADALNPLTKRYFAVVVDGEPVSFTDLYLDGDEAQVEAVATMPDHRGNGYAAAVVARAVEEARAAGASFVFLVADAEDWPQELYARLGFDEVARYLSFLRT